MSRSNPIISNPCTRWMDWDGENGIVKHYDKEREENIEVPLPFTFLALDEMAKITGWDDSARASIYSNEVRNTTDEIFSVKIGRNEAFRGYYQGIKEDVNRKGGKYTASIYLAYKGEDGLVIGNLALKGASLSAWMDFKKTHGQRVYQDAVVVKSFKEDSFEKDDGETVSFRVPVFDLKPAQDETHAIATELDEELQEYLNSRPSLEQKEENQPVSSGGDLAEDMDNIDDDLPF